MFELGLLILIVSMGIGGLLLWNKFGTESIIPTLVTVIIASYPFERLPSVDIAGASVRISQLATLALTGFLIYFSIQKIIKRENTGFELYKPSLIAALLFLLASVPSIFFIQNYLYYAASMIPLAICLLVIVIIPSIPFSILKTTRATLASLSAVAIFCAYQFVGDMVGLPIILTGLREQYTKDVFGIPRIIGTALEPLYIAGIFFLPAMFGWWYIISTLKNDYGDKNTKNQVLAWATFLISAAIISATLSKAAIAIFVLLLGGSLLLTASRIQISKFITLFIQRFAGYLLLGAILSPIVIPPLSIATQAVTSEIIHHVNETLIGNSATIVERLIFINAALLVLPSNIVFGIGAGQYSPEVYSTFPDFIKDAGNPRFFINNVYLEVWLEYGFVAFVIFLSSLMILMYKLWQSMQKVADLTTIEAVMLHGLFFSLLGYFIQWNTFSPIYIMPIFIQIGFALSIMHRINTNQPLTQLTELLQ